MAHRSGQPGVDLVPRRYPGQYARLRTAVRRHFFSPVSTTKVDYLLTKAI